MQSALVSQGTHPANKQQDVNGRERDKKKFGESPTTIARAATTSVGVLVPSIKQSTTLVTSKVAL